MLTAFQPGNTKLHRTPAEAKLGALVLGTAMLLLVRGPWMAAAILAAVLCLWTTLQWLTRARFPSIARGLAAPGALGAMMVALNAPFAPAGLAVAGGLRLAALMLASQIVAATTTLPATQRAIIRVLAPLQRLGVGNAARSALLLTLALRLIPRMAEQMEALREAQAARGGRTATLRVMMPLLVRLLRDAEAVGEALDARGWPPP